MSRGKSPVAPDKEAPNPKPNAKCPVCERLFRYGTTSRGAKLKSYPCGPDCRRINTHQRQGPAFVDY